MTHCDAILAHLKRGPITSLEAIRQYGCLRLSARILDLRRAGHKITRDMVDVRNRHGETCRVARYRLVGAR